MRTQDKELILSKSESWQMFDRISPRYDFLNHLLSFGLDIHWRKCLAKYLPAAQDLRILDLATGTADVPLTLTKLHKGIASAHGIDLAEKMLKIGEEKIKKAGLASKISLKQGDANHIPFKENHFDVVSMAFGIRNVEDPAVVMREMHRILKKPGRALILEFSLPKNQWLKGGHLFYLRNIVPAVGGLVSGDTKAYRYLNETIESFPYGEAFCDQLRQAGFENVKANELLGGVATIYQADKP